MDTTATAFPGRIQVGRWPIAALGVLALALASLAGCASSRSSPGWREPGPIRAGWSVHRVEQRHLGARRTYRLEVPPAVLAQSQPVPLVVVLHGAFSSGRGIARDTGYAELAEAEGFVAVFPDGIGLAGLLRHWNAGHCCGKAARTGIDDVGFVLEVIDDVSRRLEIDQQRIYLIGSSNGGMLAHRIAAEQPERIAAAAVWGASIGGRPRPAAEPYQIPEARIPVPMTILHGRMDEAVPYNGRAEAPAGVSALASARFWAAVNGCDREPVTGSLARGAISTEVWCPDGPAPVELLTIEGWGHDWPGGRLTARLDPGHPLHGIDAGALIWQHLRVHRRTIPPSPGTARPDQPLPADQETQNRKWPANSAISASKASGSPVAAWVDPAGASLPASASGSPPSSAADCVSPSGSAEIGRSQMPRCILESSQSALSMVIRDSALLEWSFIRPM